MLHADGDSLGVGVATARRATEAMKKVSLENMFACEAACVERLLVFDWGLTMEWTSFYTGNVCA